MCSRGATDFACMNSRTTIPSGSAYSWLPSLPQLVAGHIGLACLGGLLRASPLASRWGLTPPFISCQPSARVLEGQVFVSQWVSIQRFEGSWAGDGTLTVPLCTREWTDSANAPENWRSVALCGCARDNTPCFSACVLRVTARWWADPALRWEVMWVH